jgi:hypothetical protein
VATPVPQVEDQEGTFQVFSSVPGAAEREAIRTRIADEGPLSTHAFNTKVEERGKMWARPPHKLALD